MAEVQVAHAYNSSKLGSGDGEGFKGHPGEKVSETPFSTIGWAQ